MTGAPWAQGANGNGTKVPAPALAPAAPPGVPAGPGPGPVPMTFQLGQAQLSDGKVWIVLTCLSQQGTHIMFLDPQSAEAIGNELLRLKAAGGLLLGTQPPLGLV